MSETVEITTEQTIVDPEKGPANFNTITELHRVFLPEVYKGEANVFDCCLSVESFQLFDKKKSRKKEPTQYTYSWSAHANIRCHNIEVHLHSTRPDPFLRAFETKLRLVKEKIDLFLNLVQEIKSGERKEAFSERTWLNPEETTPDYTGYVYLTVKPDGDNRFYIADCHRTINLFVDFFANEVNSEEPVTINSGTLTFLEGLSKELERLFPLFEQLRDRFLKTVVEPE